MRGRAGPIFAGLALVGVLVLGVFPVKAWVDQRHTRQSLAAELAALDAGNQGLQERVDQLGSDEEIERLARQYNLVKPGEEQYFILPRPPAPATEEATPPPPPPRHRSKSLWERFTSLF